VYRRGAFEKECRRARFDALSRVSPRQSARAIRCMYFREMQSIDPRARVHPGFQKHIGRQSLVITAQEGRFVFLAVPEWPHEK